MFQELCFGRALSYLDATLGIDVNIQEAILIQRVLNFDHGLARVGLGGSPFQCLLVGRTQGYTQVVHSFYQ